MDKDIEYLISQMTLKEKASLCSGLDYWKTKPIKRLGVPSIMMADGPHGLRVEKGGGDHMGGGYGMPATCFPTAAATACSWDRELLRDIGRALGEEALERGISVLLGPGANIKRSPLCGRNFEYFSEDPFLSGELASAWIEGVQELGVGASLKHFAANNQEYRRMTIDAVVDERALREIYLAGFEKAVKRAHPWTVMCAYNRLNGDFCSENEWLLSGVLRHEWGFDGAVVTDWGACNDRVRGLIAGQDIEMPGSSGANDKLIVKSVESGQLDIAVLDGAVRRLLELIYRGEGNKKPGVRCDMEAHHALARRAAAESAVLLKNKGGLLPLPRGVRLAVIGELAKKPRYQGSGSSLINPWRLETAWEEIKKFAPDSVYAAGYSLDSDKPDEGMLREAEDAAGSADVALVFAGLPEDYESEGFDREHMRMPESHNELIWRVAAANPCTVVVLSKGAPVEMAWIDKVSAVLDGYLGGQAGAGGTADVLFGRVNPSGKLAETAPLSPGDALSSRYFPMGPASVEYRESLYVGYRWFDAAKIPVLFPFGHGLSYTAFEYGGISADNPVLGHSGTLDFSFPLRNTGSVAGAEVVQVYVRNADSADYRPEKELREFEKVRLEPGETKRVAFELDRRAFSYWDAAERQWRADGGEYEVLVGASSADIRLRLAVRVEGDAPDARAGGEAQEPYFNPASLAAGVPDEAFTALPGVKLPPGGAGGEPLSMNSTLGDARASFLGRRLYAVVRLVSGYTMGLRKTRLDRRVLTGMVSNLPLRSLVTMSWGLLPHSFVRFLIRRMNGGKE